MGRICKEVLGKRCGGGLLGAPRARVERQTQLRSEGVSKLRGEALGEESARLARRKTERKVNEIKKIYAKKKTKGDMICKEV